MRCVGDTVCPWVEDATEGLVVGDVYQGVVLVSSSAGGGDGGDGGGGGKRVVDAAGYGVSVEDYGAWEDGVKKGAVGGGRHTTHAIYTTAFQSHRQLLNRPFCPSRATTTV